MTTFNWSIDFMECKAAEGDLTDVVITAGWRCVAVEEIGGEEHTATTFTTAYFTQPGDPFTPYPDLTEEQVLTWCWENGVNKDAVEASLVQQIENQINPPIVQLPLPWVA